MPEELAVDRFLGIGGWPSIFRQLFARESLSEGDAYRSFCEVLAGRATEAQIAGFASSLRTKGETVEEITGCVRAMVDFAEVVEAPEGAIDTCGTGGDQLGTINVSTIAALIATGAGAIVVKHGGRAASSQAGSADVLEALGVSIALGPLGVAQCIKEAGIGFCFAPRFHPAMRHAAPVRQQLGSPTIFNILGPLANPARVKRQVIGVSDRRVAEKVLSVLEANDAIHAMVLFGHDGLDELSTVGPSTIHETRLLDGERVRRTFDIEPEALGLSRSDPQMLTGGSAQLNAERVRLVLGGEQGPQSDVVVLNAAAALIVAGLAFSFEEGLSMARDSIGSGAASVALDRLIDASNRAQGLDRPLNASSESVRT